MRDVSVLVVERFVIGCRKIQVTPKSASSNLQKISSRVRDANSFLRKSCRNIRSWQMRTVVVRQAANHRKRSRRPRRCDLSAVFLVVLYCVCYFVVFSALQLCSFFVCFCCPSHTAYNKRKTDFKQMKISAIYGPRTSLRLGSKSNRSRT